MTPQGFTIADLLGPVSGLAVSLFFCFKFLSRFEKVTDQLVETFKAELESCNARYNYIFDELMKLKEK